VKAAEGRAGLSPSLTHTATEEVKRSTTLAPSSERAPRRPALRHGYLRVQQPLPTEERSAAHGSVRGPYFGPVSSGQFGVPSKFLGQFGQLPEQQQEEEEEKESRPFQRRSPGDASVNARAMSRRKQGNPQHLSQREITRKYTCKRTSSQLSNVFSFYWHSQKLSVFLFFSFFFRCVKLNIFRVGAESFCRSVP